MPALCIVPTPLAAARATRRLCDAQGGILFGPRVGTLERVAQGLLAAGADRRAVLSPLAERLLAVEAARASEGPLAGEEPDGGLAAALSGVLRELRRGEVTVAAARAAARALTGGAAARLLAVASALEAYEELLTRRSVVDRAGALRAAAEAARRGASSPETEGLDLLVVDGLSAAAPAEWDLLAALAARARRTRFHLPFFPERPDACAPAEALLRRIEGLHEVAARREIEVVLPGLGPDRRAGLPAALLAVLGGGRLGPAASGGLVRAEPGAGEAGEAVAVARALARLLDGGHDAEDVVVVAPSPRRVAPALARACAAAGVPFATGRGPPLAEVGSVRAVLDALDAARGLDRSTAERLAASTYLAPQGLPGALAPLLDRAGAIDGRGAPELALRRRAEALTAPAARAERELLLRAAAGLEGLAALARPLGRTGTAREHAARIAAFVDAAGLRRRAARAPRAVAARDLAGLASLTDVLDGLVRALALVGRGEEAIPAGAMRALVALAADEATLPPPLEPAAGAVELFGIEDAPGLSARAAVVTGCARGVWPPAPGPEALLREPERQAICRELRRPAIATAPARRAEAAFRAFSAAAAGREAVVFTWAAPGPAGDGAPFAPALSDALGALGLPVPAAPQGDPQLADARTSREALRAAARAGPAAARALGGTPLGARAAAGVARGRLEVARREAVRARRAVAYAGAPAGPARGALRAALPAEWSPTQLEEYARCPFRLFLKLGARLEEPGAEGLDIDGRDEGSLVHAVLERFVAARVARRAWPPEASDRDLAEARAAAEDVFLSFEREGRTGDPAVWAARREAVLSRLDRVVRGEARDHGGLAPALLEHAFGGRSGRPPLALVHGDETVRLRGRIDRVDVGADRLLVLDYKNAKAGRSGHAELLDPESFGRTSFQIPTYLLAAARELPGKRRLLATYALLRSAERLAPVELDAGAPVDGDRGGNRGGAGAGTGGDAPTAPAPRASADGGEAGGAVADFAASVAALVRRIGAGEFPIASRTCEHCAFGAVCRFEGAAAAGAGDDAEAVAP